MQLRRTEKEKESGYIQAAFSMTHLSVSSSLPEGMYAFRSLRFKLTS